MSEDENTTDEEREGEPGQSPPEEQDPESGPASDPPPGQEPGEGKQYDL